MNDRMYELIAGVLEALLWDGELIGRENLPQEGPAIFIANHLVQLGPIGAVCSLPMRVYPWIHGDMVDKEKAAAYLNWDFVERTLKLRPPLSLAVARALSRITVPLLRSIGCVGVQRGYEYIQSTWQESLDLLLAGKFLLVFPEDNQLEYNPETHMAPFQKSVFRLGEIYHQSMQKRLAFYPLAIHESHRVMAGQPYWYNPSNPPAVERRRLKNALEQAVIRMYLQMAEGTFTGEPVPVRKVR